MTSKHPDTIGEIVWDGKTYEIDWPYKMDSDTEREAYGIFYLDGRPRGEFCKPRMEEFETADEVMALAKAWLENGWQEDDA